MNRSLLIALPLLVLVGMLAAGCAPPATVEAALQATMTPAADVAPMAAPATADSADSAEITPDQQAALPQSTRPDSECIDCHSNAEQLQLLAEEEEVQESLNEGSG